MTAFLPVHWVHNDDGTTTQRGGPPGSYQGRCDSNFRPSPIRDSQKLNAQNGIEERRETISSKMPRIGKTSRISKARADKMPDGE